MTPQTASLVTALLKLYFTGRPHGRATYGANGSIVCRCDKCQAWDAVEKFSQSDFDELEAELRKSKNLAGGLTTSGKPSPELVLRPPLQNKPTNKKEI